MWKEENVLKKIEELNKLNNNIIINEYKFKIEGKPENYVRERSSSKNNHFYNPKQKIIEDYRKSFIHQLKKSEYNEIKSFIDSDSYSVDVHCEFYIPIPKNDSNIIAAKKEMKLILPDKRPDLDNYIKLLLDSLHNVVYSDDAKVCSFTAEKFYSINPRTEILIKIKRIKEE